MPVNTGITLKSFPMRGLIISPNIMMVECIIQPTTGGTAQKNQFADIQNLHNRKVLAIQTFSNLDVVNSPISTSNPIIPIDVFNSCFLSLYRAGVGDQQEGLAYDQIPLSMLRNVYNNNGSTPLPSGIYDLFRIDPTEISWAKSYISIPNSVAIGTQQYSALFAVHYLTEKQSGDPNFVNRYK